MTTSSSQSQHPTTSDPRWKALLTRTTARDGEFYYSVSTTGIYCRPSCKARLPRPENVAFHPTIRAAEEAGYRPCKRCRPNEAPLAKRQAEQVAALCRFITESSSEPSLKELADQIGASASHTQRLFKSVTGVTPKQYAGEHRRQRVRAALQEQPSVTQAIYAAGYGSAAQFYESAPEVLGMPPQVYAAGAKAEVIRFAIAESWLGPVLVAATKRGLCAILMGDDPQELTDDLARRFPAAELTGTEPEFDVLVAKVIALIDQPTASAELPLDMRGTAFQQRVWAALRQIPPGQTTNYAELATRIGLAKGARAVAGACAANPLAVAVPCHRVVRRDGTLSGYRWGVERKQKLLERETGDDPNLGTRQLD